MASFHGTIHSDALGMMTDVSVILPQHSTRLSDKGEIPVVYLLHGLSDNHSAWSRRTMVDLYSDETGLALIMPEVQRGFYTDMVYGLNYFTYLTEELPGICHSLFRVSDDPAHTYIAGLSMGGYGALRAALTCPERYRAAASFSGAVDVRRILRDQSGTMPQKERIALVGDGLKDHEDIFMLASSGKIFPPLYLCCGTRDGLLGDNRRLHEHLDNLGIPNTYEEWDGSHEWRFWDTAIEKALHRFASLD